MLPPRRGGPTPPPRDPSGIHTLVRSLLDLRTTEDDMSSDSGSSPTRYRRPDAPLLVDRRSSYENVPPPRPPSSVRRSTPSPRPQRHASPDPPPLRRRPASACGGRIPTPRSAQHRECSGAATWSHGCGALGCCGAASPVQPCHHWCGGSPQTWGHYHHQGGDSSHDCEDRLQQRIWQLELEKEQLTLQVNVLSEQVEAQSEKMFELETSLSQNQEQLLASEELLNKEMSCRSSAESSRFDLLAEISELRSRLSQMEMEKKQTLEKNRKLENELLLTAACLAEKEADLASFKSRLNGEHSNPELEKLKSALSSVVAENEEKEKKIQELKSSLHRYKKLHQLVLSNYSPKNDSEGFSKIAPHSEDNFLSALDNLASCADINDVVVLDKPPPVPFYSSNENVVPQKTPPSKRHFSTLPRPHQADVLKQFDTKSPTMTVTGGSLSTQDLRRNEVRRSATKAPSGASFGRGFFKLKGGKRSSSAPQLAPDQLEDSFAENDRRTPVPPTKVKGFRKIFGKVKRSGSESLNSSAAELKRGGIRATAGPRLGWPEENKFKTPFCEWECDRVCEWLVSIGLGMYAPECKRWGKGGRDLLKATDFEKELCIRSPLHRKKLLLCLLGAKGGVGEPESRLDHQWVVRWLDDIGLPQYKDAFLEGRVDGRMLHHLTMEDLSHLKVFNQLHTISIRTGIQVLRENNFDPFALQRRSLPEDSEGVDVSRWSIHRVMEWLRTVDLSEYAPNLRGSGVHGGIMLYESRFDADLLATLLNIPPNKTLLRRHLSTQFKQLIGPEAMRGKREAANHVPLSPSAKVKSVKRSPFSLVKRKNREEGEEYVCPMQNRTEEEKFLMKEMVLKNEEMLESMPTSTV